MRCASGRVAPPCFRPHGFQTAADTQPLPLATGLWIVFGWMSQTRVSVVALRCSLDSFALDTRTRREKK